MLYTTLWWKANSCSWRNALKERLKFASKPVLADNSRKQVVEVKMIYHTEKKSWNNSSKNVFKGKSWLKGTMDTSGIYHSKQTYRWRISFHYIIKQHKLKKNSLRFHWSQFYNTLGTQTGVNTDKILTNIPEMHSSYSRQKQQSIHQSASFQWSPEASEIKKGFKSCDLWQDIWLTDCHDTKCFINITEIN